MTIEEQIREAAKKYSMHMCGDELKNSPILNKYVPKYMEYAFKAGAAFGRKLERERIINIVQDFGEGGNIHNFRILMERLEQE